MFIRLVLFIYLGRWVKWNECPTQRDNEREATKQKEPHERKQREFWEIYGFDLANRL